MSKNSIVVPEAKEALERFKMEAASEVGVNLKQGYNGDLTSRQAGSVGGQMVNNVLPIRKMVFKREARTSKGHSQKYTYLLKVCYIEPPKIDPEEKVHCITTDVEIQ